MNEKQGFLADNITEAIQSNRKRFQEWFSFAEELNQYALQVMLGLTLHNKDRQECLIGPLFARIMETYEGAFLLAERGMVAGAKMLARGMLEALFSLGAIAKDDSFARVFILDDTIQRKNVVKKHKEWKRDFFNEPSEAEAFQQDIEDKIKKENLKELRTSDIAIKAGMKDLYLTGYTLLSSTIHSRSRDLGEQYLQSDPDGDITAIYFGPDGKDKDFEEVLISITYTLLKTLHSVGTFFKQDECLNKVKQFFVQFQNLQKVEHNV